MNPMICCHPSDLVCQHWSCSKNTHDIVLLSTAHPSALTVTLSSLVAFPCSYNLFLYNQAPWSFKNILGVCVCLYTLYDIWFIYLFFCAYICQAVQMSVFLKLSHSVSQSLCKTSPATTKRHGFVKNKTRHRRQHF